MKTIKQIADALGIDKQKVYRYIRKHHINEAHHDAGVMCYDDVVADRIIAGLLENGRISEVHHDALQAASSDAVVDVVISMLKAELEMKNEQIRELNARLAESSAALVSAQQAAQIAQVLHAGTMQKQSVKDKLDAGISIVEKKSIFGWLKKTINKI